MRRMIRRIAHIPEKWTPVFRKGYAPLNLGAVALAVAAPMVAGCSSDNFSNFNILPKSSEVVRQDWLTYSGGKEEFTLRAVSPADLVGPEGQCAGAAPDPNAEPGTPAMPQGGISLQMTECEVVRRAGTPENVEMGSNPRGDRTVVLTYSRGLRPGVYRFVSGRLQSIERGPEPANARPQQKAAPKKRGA
jgi:hypothetical protein